MNSVQRAIYSDIIMITISGLLGNNLGGLLAIESLYLLLYITANMAAMFFFF